MRELKGMISLVILLLLCVIVLTGCLEEGDFEEAEVTSTVAENVEETSDVEEEDELWSASDNVSCPTNQKEVEQDICGYVPACDDSDSCEAWAEIMIMDMEQWLGNLTYSEEWDVDEEDSEKETVEIAAYSVNGNTLELNPTNEDEEYYAWLWDRFAWIIPSEQRWMISRFEVYDHADTMAYVIQHEDDYEQWTYAANQVQATYETERVMTDVHEFGHLLALNSEEVDPFMEESECSTYMLDEGCPYEDSYLYSFYLQFWEAGNEENENDYVTEYAMSNVYEDFAESWSYFVMTPRPEVGSVADQKVLFFYQYDELIMLKAEILGRAAAWLDHNVE